MLWQKSKPAALPTPFSFAGLETWPERSRYMLATFNQEVRRVYKRLGRIASSHAPVLLRGEQGCGKTVVAQALHHARPAPARMLLVVDCESTTEAQLAQAFAHILLEAKRNVNTNGKHGSRQALRPNVTILLKNVAALELAAQLWLFQLLQEKAARTTAPETAEVRLIATAEQALAPLVEQQSFRQDLYYRLSTYEFELPPLRERQEDLFSFVAHFCAEAARQKHGENLPLSAQALAALQAHPWPGNLRELNETLARADEVHRGRAHGIEHVEFMTVSSNTTELEDSLREGSNGAARNNFPQAASVSKNVNGEMKDLSGVIAQSSSARKGGVAECSA